MEGTDVEHLFKEHSVEELKSVRDNLAVEIEKKTDQLKSIVKNKYRDIVETSDAVQFMSSNLHKVELSLQSLEESVKNFYSNIRDTQDKGSAFDDKDVAMSLHESHIPQDDEESKCNRIIQKCLRYSSEFWESFDQGDYGTSIKILDEARGYTKQVDLNSMNHKQRTIINRLNMTFDRGSKMIRDNLWYQVKSAGPDQIGMIAGIDQKELYEVSLISSIQFLVAKFSKDSSDMSFHAQVRRYQPHSYYNVQNHEIRDEDYITQNLGELANFVQMPKFMSAELSEFLFGVCKVINTIAGFDLNRSSIVASLRLMIELTCSIYTELITTMESMRADSKRKRALQLYFDLLYMRMLLNTSRCIELIEELDPKVSQLMSTYEQILDPIELCTISEAMHENVVNLCRSTTRLYGLLIPHLE